ncbi:hypothetical protein DEO72_LG2g2997 [Vigna unguiculata]|uniref:Uncharacterized protein n=1 Tax=Vigna unguiculata TaxID=3917 RepID=A0A4D6L293_VIGUN|nr:hypothetical protein DEO72_LG2g2997 [Vigna unguiculata]
MSSGGKNVPPGGAYNSGPFQNPQHLRVTQNLPYPATQMHFAPCFNPVWQPYSASFLQQHAGPYQPQNQQLSQPCWEPFGAPYQQGNVSQSQQYAEPYCNQVNKSQFEQPYFQQLLQMDGPFFDQLQQGSLISEIQDLSNQMAQLVAAVKKLERRESETSLCKSVEEAITKEALVVEAPDFDCHTDFSAAKTCLEAPIEDVSHTLVMQYFEMEFQVVLDDPAPDFDAFHLSHTAPLELNSATTDFSNFHILLHFLLKNMMLTENGSFAGIVDLKVDLADLEFSTDSAVDLHINVEVEFDDQAVELNGVYNADFDVNNIGGVLFSEYETAEYGGRANQRRQSGQNKSAQGKKDEKSNLRPCE